MTYEQLELPICQGQTCGHTDFLVKVCRSQEKWTDSSNKKTEKQQKSKKVSKLGVDFFTRLSDFCENSPKKIDPSGLSLRMLRTLSALNRDGVLPDASLHWEKLGTFVSGRSSTLNTLTTLQESVFPAFPKTEREYTSLADLLEQEVDEKYFLSNEQTQKILLNCKKIAGRWGMDHQAGSIYDKQGLSPALDTCGGGSREPHIVDDDSKVKQIGHIVGYGLENPQPYRVYDESGAAPTLTSASDGKVPMVVDKEVNQIGHGMSKDGKPIQGYGVFDTDGVAPTLTTGHGSAQPYVMDEQKINVLGSYSPSGYNATRVVSPDGIVTTVMENHGQVTAVTIQAILTPDRTEKRQNGRRIKDDGEPMFTLTTQDRHGVVIGSCYTHGKESSSNRPLMQNTSRTVLAEQRVGIAISDMPQVVGGVGEPNAFGKQFRQGNRIYSTDSVSPALQTNNGNASGGSVLVATEDE